MKSNMRRSPLCFLFFAVLIFAKQTPAATLTIVDAVQVAQTTSPDIKQLEEQVASARSKARLAIAPYEPSVTLTKNDLIKEFGFSTEASDVVQISQTIGFPGRALLNRSMLSEQAEAIKYQLIAMKLQVSVNVKTAYYNLQLARMNIQLNADTKLAYERVLSIAKRRYEAGAAAQVDYISAQVALIANGNDLEDLLTNEKQARAQLNTLLKYPLDAEVETEPIKMIYHPKIELNQATSRMLNNRNEIKAAKMTEHAANKASKLAWMSLLPDFQFSIGWTSYGEGFASPYSGDQNRFGQDWPTHTYSAGVQFTVPIWFFLNEKEVIVGASHDHAAAERNLDIVFNQSKVALENAVDTLNSTENKIETFERHLLPLAEQGLNLAITDYSSGKVDFQTLAATAAVRRQTRLNYATAVVSYLTNYATYSQLVGEDFE